MNRVSLLILPFLILGAIAIGCGGGGKKTVKIGDTKVDVSGKLPSDFPDDFPKYKGADVEGSATGSQGGISGTVVTWTTGDSVDDVTEFYSKAFEDGPWKSTANGNIGGSSYWSADSPDGKKSAYVMVAEADGKTSIIAVVGDKDDLGMDDETSTSDDSSSDEETPTDSSDDSSAEPTEASEPLPDEVSLSDDFPKDRVPLPSGARVTSDSNYSSGGQTTFIIELYVKDDPDKVADFFKTELPKKGWTDAFSSVSNGEYLLTFATADTDEGITMSIAKADTPGYAVVTLTLAVKA